MSCSGCQLTQTEPSTVPLHAWEWPSSSWRRIHIDFAGPFLGGSGCTFKVARDSFQPSNPAAKQLAARRARLNMFLLKDNQTQRGWSQPDCTIELPTFRALVLFLRIACCVELFFGKLRDWLKGEEL